MRTSSIKSLVSAVTIVATLTLAVPIAEARAREPRTGRSDTIVRAVLNLLKRIGRVATTGGPSVPLTEPVAGEGNDGTPSTTTTGETVQQ